MATPTSVLNARVRKLGSLFWMLLLFTDSQSIIAFVSPSMFHTQFTAVNLSVAIAAVRDNMGLFLAALIFAAVGFIWLVIAVTAAVSAHKLYGNWTVLVSVFSYYWTHQVLTNCLTVATAGIIGRWFVIGEKTPTFTTGLKVSL